VAVRARAGAVVVLNPVTGADSDWAVRANPERALAGRRQQVLL
jgi:hypothetical protein